VEDSSDDVLLTQAVLRDGKVANELSVVGDGEQALAYLRREGQFAGATRPDLVLLDLNLPRKDGREVLQEIKADADLRTIPVIVLTTSQADVDVLHAYRHQASAYVAKPVDLDDFVETVRSFEEFWLTIVLLPPETR
jgi:CheY-like chemotaxis protein